MPLITNIERRTIERTTKEIRKETRKQDIIKILEDRFDNLPENIINTLNIIDDISVLDELLLPSIKVNSVEEFEQLINQKINK